MNDITQSTIDELRRLSAAATHGPWERGGPYPGTSVIVMTDPGSTHPEFAEPPHYEPIAVLDQSQQGEPNHQAVADAELIAALRNNIDTLIDALETAQANERRYRWLRDNHSQTYGMHIDGMAGYRMHGVLRGHFTSLDAAIDAAIAATEVEHGK